MQLGTRDDRGVTPRLSAYRRRFTRWLRLRRRCRKGRRCSSATGPPDWLTMSHRVRLECRARPAQLRWPAMSQRRPPATLSPLGLGLLPWRPLDPGARQQRALAAWLWVEHRDHRRAARLVAWRLRARLRASTDHAALFICDRGHDANSEAVRARYSTATELRCWRCSGTS